MNSPASNPLLVELYLEQARLSGITYQVEERRRLIDVLNARDEAFHLQAAKLSMVGGQKRDLETIAVEKRSIIAAIPRETVEQSRQRTLLRTVVGRRPTQPLDLTLIAPPFVVQGTAHLLAGQASIKGRLRADPDLFTRFFSVTDGRLYLPDGGTIEAPVILVNRDTLVAVSLDAAA
jgi:hypothetical protein